MKFYKKLIKNLIKMLLTVEIRKQVWKIKLLKVAGGLETVVKIT